MWGCSSWVSYTITALLTRKQTTVSPVFLHWLVRTMTVLLALWAKYVVWRYYLPIHSSEKCSVKPCNTVMSFGARGSAARHRRRHVSFEKRTTDSQLNITKEWSCTLKVFLCDSHSTIGQLKQLDYWGKGTRAFFQCYINIAEFHFTSFHFPEGDSDKHSDLFLHWGKSTNDLKWTRAPSALVYIFLSVNSYGKMKWNINHPCYWWIPLHPYILCILLPRN